MTKQAAALLRPLQSLPGVGPSIAHTFRCAIHSVERGKHSQACLQWWNWSDEKQGKRRPH